MPARASRSVMVKENDYIRMWRDGRRWSIDLIGTPTLLIYSTKRDAMSAWDRIMEKAPWRKATNVT